MPEILREKATVYRVGHRRFFTLKAARRQLAKDRLYLKFPCDCTSYEPDTGYEGHRCRLHAMSSDHFSRLLDRMATHTIPFFGANLTTDFIRVTK